MAKSSHSNWKKRHKRIRAEAEKKNVVKRVRQLNGKLRLIAKGGLSRVPAEAPPAHFFFSKPSMNPTEPLQLEPMETNVYGKTVDDEPHPQAMDVEEVDKAQPLGGHAVSHEDMRRMEAAISMVVMEESSTLDCGRKTVGRKLRIAEGQGGLSTRRSVGKKSAKV